MLDLFCGLGNFIIFVVCCVVGVVGVEVSDVMVCCGYENVCCNGLENVVFYVWDLDSVFKG